MALKAKQPELVVPTKPKFMISGESGVGKTFFALEFPKPYLIDSEGGATREQYMEKLRKAGGVYFGKEDGAQDFKTVNEEVRQLCTTKHEYKTLIIDSFSYLYMLEAADAETKVGSEFGRDKRVANIPTRQLMTLLEKIDMNVILIAHSKDKWERRGKDLINAGTTFDGWEKMEYTLDLWIEIIKGGRTFNVKKSRITSLPQGQAFPLSYDKFAELYGKTVIESETKPIVLATDEQVEHTKKLVQLLAIDQETIDKWFKQCGVESFNDMSQEQVLKCINHMEKKISDLNIKETK